MKWQKLLGPDMNGQGTDVKKNSNIAEKKSMGVILFQKYSKSKKNNIATNTRTGSQKIMAEAGTFSPAYLTVIQRSEENISAPSIYAW